ncbi:MAG: hypothetical protein A2Y23_10560 [Clostridiales bacterium GWB2_37_7]|nr:MAG: hypothetical protein A2Y23_10560 [Clostridiales bacterium GWB2_37_7]
MFSFKNRNQGLISPRMSIIAQFISMLLISIVVALLVQQNWIKNLNLYHTVLELAGIFIALAIFISVWFTYDKCQDGSYILGFGYLAAAIFSAFHVYYYVKFDPTAITYLDLSARFWILGRLAESITILLAVSFCRIFVSKYLNLLITLAVAVGVSYFVVVYNNMLPLLMTAEGDTPSRIFIGYMIIVINVISLWGMRDKLHDKGKITYRYIFVSLLLSISAEICLILYSLINNFIGSVGQILKVISYFYLFKGIYISTIIFPYDELALKNKNMEAVNAKLSKMSSTMKDMLDALPIAVQKYDSKGRLKYTNKKFEELLQCDRKQLENLSVLDVANMFAMDIYDENTLEAQLSKCRTTNVIESFRTLKGETKQLSVKSQSIRNGTLLMFSDAKKEQELQNLNIQAETILNAINNGIMMINESRKIILFNKVFEDIYEIDKKQIIGRDIDYLNQQTSFEAKQLPDKMLNESMSSQAFDVTITSFKGNKKELNFCVSPIKNLVGDIIGEITIGTDETENKKEQKRIMQQEKLALLGQMGAGIVHETRNFLTTIKGRCQLIDMHTTDEVIKKHSSKINSDVEEVNRIMSEFLFLSKPREIDLVEVSIHDVFESIKGMVEASSLIRGVKFELILCDDDRYLLCDESQLKQVMLNICKNGIDAMTNQPNAKLVVETYINEKNNEVNISIKDNGRGIEKEELNKIGTPFFTTKRTGTGLGLSVCYKIIRDHGGRIDVQSELGKGTSFTIILPCIEYEEQEEII